MTRSTKELVDAALKASDRLSDSAYYGLHSSFGKVLAAEVRALREELEATVPLTVYEQAVKGRQDFRAAYKGALATIQRVEALQPKWRDQSKACHGSSFADGGAFTLCACADDLRDALKGGE